MSSSTRKDWTPTARLTSNNRMFSRRMSVVPIVRGTHWLVNRRILVVNHPAASSNQNVTMNMTFHTGNVACYRIVLGCELTEQLQPTTIVTIAVFRAKSPKISSNGCHLEIHKLKNCIIDHKRLKQNFDFSVTRIKNKKRGQLDNSA